MFVFVVECGTSVRKLKLNEQCEGNEHKLCNLHNEGNNAFQYELEGLSRQKKTRRDDGSFIVKYFEKNNKNKITVIAAKKNFEYLTLTLNLYFTYFFNQSQLKHECLNTKWMI